MIRKSGKNITTTESEEELELNQFINNFLSRDIPFKDKILDSFLSDKLDPQSKIIIRGYDKKNDRILHEQSDNIGEVETSSKFLGCRFRKVKLQIRLETIDDINNLIKFLEYIRPCLGEDSDEQNINENRKRTLKKILNEPDNFPKINWNGGY